MPTESANETYNLPYRHSVDDKRRVPVPFRWRPKEPIDFTIVVWPKHAAGTCLRVFPPGPWARFLAEIEAVPDVARKSALKRMTAIKSTTMKLDAAGRLTIPEDMAMQADIRNQAIMVPDLDRFEIWSPARYEEMLKQDEEPWKQALQSLGE